MIPAIAVLPSPPAAPVETPRPNIILVMADDMSSEIVSYMREVQDLAAAGVTFDNFFVANSLCCPSRGTFYTGKYPHNSKIQGNGWPRGGFGRFLEHNLHTSLGPYMSAAGYRTGMLGKFMNGYDATGDTDGIAPPDYPEAYVPPGWDEWFATGGGYQSFDYEAVQSVDGVTRLVTFSGGDEADYITDVLAGRARSFVGRAARHPEGTPFLLVIAPFAVHGNGDSRADPQRPGGPQFPPAPRDRADSPHRPDDWASPTFPDGDCGRRVDGGCAEVAFPDPTWGSFNKLISDPPIHAPTEVLPPERLAELEIRHLHRVQMAQAVDDLVRTVRRKVKVSGLSGETYVIFTSDNGFHMGEHALGGNGKSTAFDHDVRFPLIIYPPGGTSRVVKHQLIQNADLLPTFLAIAGAEVPKDIDGVSFLGLVGGADSDSLPWRRGALIEHKGGSGDAVTFEMDPDVDPDAGQPPPYVGIRTHHYLYVDYSTLDSIPPEPGYAEFYDLATDPYMLANKFHTLTALQRAALNEEAVAYAACSGSGCWEVALEVPPP